MAHTRASFHYVRPKLYMYLLSFNFLKVLTLWCSTGKEGPVHDVQWSFSGSEFAVVYGCILFQSALTIYLYEFIEDYYFLLYVIIN